VVAKFESTKLLQVCSVYKNYYIFAFWYYFWYMSFDTMLTHSFIFNTVLTYGLISLSLDTMLTYGLIFIFEILCLFVYSLFYLYFYAMLAYGLIFKF
jgi:hypothetical protein